MHLRYSLFLLGTYTLTFWLFRHPATLAFLAGAILLPFFSGRVLVNWKDGLLLLISMAGLPAHLGTDDGLVVMAQVIGLGWLLSIVSQQATFTSRTARTFTWCVLASSCAVAAFMLCQVAPGQFSFNPVDVLTRNRNHGWFLIGDAINGPTIIASALTVGIIAGLSLISDGRMLLPKVGILMGLCAALILSCGRTALVAGAVVVLMFLATYRGNRMGSRVHVLGMVIVLPAICLIPFISALQDYQSTGFWERLDSMLRLEADDAVEGRFERWRYGVDMMVTEPMGHGYEYFQQLDGFTLHSEYLAQFVGAGWAAGSLYVLLMGLLTLRALRLLWACDPDRYPARFLAAGVLVLGALVGLTENFSLSSRWVFYPTFWLSIGLLMNTSFVGSKGSIQPSQATSTGGSE